MYLFPIIPLFSALAVSYSRIRKLFFSPQLPNRQQTLSVPGILSFALHSAKSMQPSVLATRYTTHAQTIVPGEKLQGRYLIVKKLGAGGMGAVYEALDERLQVTVAIKETFAVDGRLRRQFEQEARLLAQLTHAALPRVSDYFSE